MRRAAVCTSSWGRDGAAAPRREVEGVVVEDDAVLVLGIRGRARYAQAHVPKRRRHHRVPKTT